MPSAKKKLTYEQATTRLEEIVNNLERGDLALDSLAQQIKEAQELLSFCRKKLTQVETDVKRILEDGEEGNVGKEEKDRKDGKEGKEGEEDGKE